MSEEGQLQDDKKEREIIRGNRGGLNIDRKQRIKAKLMVEQVIEKRERKWPQKKQKGCYLQKKKSDILLNPKAVLHLRKTCNITAFTK